jgi:hypothetical protein
MSKITHYVDTYLDTLKSKGTLGTDANGKIQEGTAVVTDHGNLTGLGDDDHTQYWLSGTARTGNFSTSGTLGAGATTLTGALDINKTSTTALTVCDDSDVCTLKVNTTGKKVSVGPYADTAQKELDIYFGHMNFTIVPNPTYYAGASLAAGGSVDTGVHYYLYRYVLADGRFTAFTGRAQTDMNADYTLSTGSKITTTSGNNTVNLTIPTSPNPLVTKIQVYRTKTTHAANHYFLVELDNTGATVSHSDTATDASLGTTNYINYFYAENNTAGKLFVNDSSVLFVGSGSNLCLGYKAGYVITNGIQATFVGFQAGVACTTGGQDTLVGNDAGYALTTASNVTAVGTKCFNTITTASGNTGVGSQAGRSIAAGSTPINNTFIGVNAGFHTSQLTTVKYSIAIGANAYTTADNTCILGGTGASGLSSITINGLTDTDIGLIFAGTSNTGTLTYLEDEDYFVFSEVVDALGYRVGTAVGQDATMSVLDADGTTVHSLTFTKGILTAHSTA